MSRFRILDPYAVPGTYRKAQLHVHSNRSIDGKWRMEELVERYRALGYTFIFITDHDRVTHGDAHSTRDFLVLPGEEYTVPRPVWPLGRHMLRLFVNERLRRGSLQERIEETVRAGGVVGVAHPHWPGNFGTGLWREKALLPLRSVHLFEIFNYHSNSAVDISLWHRLLLARGPGDPLWGIAVDDAHHAGAANQGWIVAKVREISADALRDALIGGHFYATTGPWARFGVEAGRILAQGPERSMIRFVGSQNEVLEEFREPEGSYWPNGSERFVRAEVRDKDGHTAWSQPFWILPEKDQASPHPNA